MAGLLLLLFLSIALLSLSERAAAFTGHVGKNQNQNYHLQGLPTSLWPVPKAEDRLFSAEGAGGTHQPVIDMCHEFYYDSFIDHFSWAHGSSTYKQRVFMCDKYWTSDEKTKRKGPIFFYTGNEADVTLYLNATGFMWELAQDVGALLIFAEHRYYGKSHPFGQDDMKNLAYLTSEQALADYAELISYMKEDLNAVDSPVISFGGSYGGMLSTWFRMKYPALVDGSFAASAPIWSYLGETPPYDAGSFAKIVTYDATQEAGASSYCARNVRKSWEVAFNLSSTDQGRKQIAETFRLCDDVPMESADNVTSLLLWAQNAFDYMAMGNYPYPSSYMLNGKGDLPAFPMRVSCEYMKDPLLTDLELIRGLAQASSVWYNYTSDLTCMDYRQGVNPETQDVGVLWGYQWCTEQFMPSSRDGINDMFFPQPFDYSFSIESCQKQWGVSPNPYWSKVNFGGKDISTYSNIIFSNGEYDPWNGGGVLHNITDSLHAVFIEGGAHHLDFMWSTKNDPQAVLNARAQERSIIKGWITQAYSQKMQKREL